MSVVTIENIRERVRSIITEIRPKSVDGNRLGNLLMDIVDTLNKLHADLNEAKIDKEDIVSNADLPQTTVGKVLDGRVYGAINKELKDNYIRKAELLDMFQRDPFMVFEKGDVYRETEIKLTTSLLGVILRDKTSGAIIRSELVPQKPNQTIDMHLLRVNEETGERQVMVVNLYMRDGELIQFFTPDKLNLNNYTVELYSFV